MLIIGHAAMVHQPRLMPASRDPRIGLFGVPSGQERGGNGPRGVYQVTLSQGSPVQADFLPMAQVEWCRLEVDVSECQTVADVQERIVSAQFAANADACCQRMIFRVTLLARRASIRALTPMCLTTFVRR